MTLPPASGARILVIDDERACRKLVCQALTRHGMEVMTAENGQSGVELARSQFPDLILCDVNMEGGDGYMALEALRQDPATAMIPFILMTGLADRSGMRRGMELGADDYLSKPFTVPELLGAVSARLTKHRIQMNLADERLEDLRSHLSTMLPHELNTPLAGILGAGEMLQETPGLPPNEIAELGKMMVASAQRLQKLIGKYLLYAQAELWRSDPAQPARLQSQRTGVNARMVRQCLEPLAAEMERAADLELRVDDAQATISSDLLGRIMRELVENAFKFSAPGSPVVLAITGKSDGMHLAVSDRGRGLSREAIARIGAYMQFERKVYEQQGAGLGLAIVKQLAELHGGRIQVVSEPGIGTTVEVHLPGGATG